MIDMEPRQLTHEEITEIRVEGEKKKSREEEKQKSAVKAYEMLIETGISIPVALQTTARKFEIPLDQLKELISRNSI